jgi:hypothetical protein
MQIKIKEGVVWDTESTKQSEATIEWYRANVQPIIDEAHPQNDKYGRPVKWQVEVDGVVVIKTRIYTSESNSWAMEKDVITLKVA